MSRALAAISLAGLGLDLFGALYLAYDLLGAGRGPLRTVTRVLTYSLAFTALLSLGVGFPFGTLAGAGLGFLLGLEFGLRPHTASLSLVSDVFAVLRGLTLGVAGAVAFGLRFGLVVAVAASIWLVVVYRLKFSVASEYTLDRQTSPVRWPVVRNQLVRIAGTSAAVWLAAFAGGWSWPAAMVFTVRYGVSAFVAGSVIGSGAPRVEVWADSLPARRLGLFGTILILAGFALSSVQYWVALFR